MSDSRPDAGTRKVPRRAGHHHEGGVLANIRPSRQPGGGGERPIAAFRGIQRWDAVQPAKREREHAPDRRGSSLLPFAPRVQENRHLVPRDCAGAYDHAYAPPLTKGDSRWRGALPFAG